MRQTITWTNACRCQTPYVRCHLAKANSVMSHDDVINGNIFCLLALCWGNPPVIGVWPFEKGIHCSPVNFPHKGQWRGALMFSLSCAWKTAEQPIETLAIWGHMHSLWRHCNGRAGSSSCIKMCPNNQSDLKMFEISITTQITYFYRAVYHVECLRLASSMSVLIG